MTTITNDSPVAPVVKSVTVAADVTLAFHVFTEEFDSWWPRSHHIGTSPMSRAIIEGRVGGRCYSEQEDGTDCPWGTVLAWEPPTRLVIAWQIHGDWTYQPDVAQASEVEVRFTPLGDGSTRVDLTHRHLDRHGAGAAAMRTAVDSPGGWGSLLELYAGAVAKHERASR
jgi:uncharacterized protein YndB with AHSA1/START domain